MIEELIDQSAKMAKVFMQDLERIRKLYREEVGQKDEISKSQAQEIERLMKECEEHLQRKAHGSLDEKILSLNVGGFVGIMAAKSLLCKVDGSKLALTFKDDDMVKRVNNLLFVDRDHKPFQDMLSYMRNDLKMADDEMAQDKRLHLELEFWGIPTP